MIKRLRNRFIRIAMLSVTAVMMLLTIILNVANYVSTDSDLKQTLTLIYENAGTIPHSRFQLPDSADAPTPPENRGGSGDIATLAESGKAVYDMYAISTDGLMTMNVTYQNLGLLSGSSMSAQEYVELAAAKVPGDLTAGGFTDVEVQVTATDIAGEKSCPTLLVTAKLGETPMYERMVCLQAGNYIYCVTLCSFTEDVTPTMAELFHTAG